MTQAKSLPGVSQGVKKARLEETAVDCSSLSVQGWGMEELCQIAKVASNLSITFLFGL